MPYWKLFYHLIWATKDRAIFIHADVESVILSSYKVTAVDAGFVLRSVGFMPDHCHLVVSIPPSLAISEAVKRLKGASSHGVRERVNPTFSWQPDYGVLSFSERDLDSVKTYVENQKDIHQRRATRIALERMTP